MIAMRLLVLTAIAAGIIPAARQAPASMQTSSSRLAKDRPVETRHLSVRTSTGAEAPAAGARLSLFLDIAPKPNMHVYAPEQKDLIPISITLEADPAFTAHTPRFPKAETYFFAPLGETQFVYSKPFRIVQDVTLSEDAGARDTAAMTIRGTLRYQACDDSVCYMPVTVPVSWTVGAKSGGR